MRERVGCPAQVPTPGRPSVNTALLAEVLSAPPRLPPNILPLGVINSESEFLAAERFHSNFILQERVGTALTFSSRGRSSQKPV